MPVVTMNLWFFIANYMHFNFFKNYIANRPLPKYFSKYVLQNTAISLYIIAQIQYLMVYANFNIIMIVVNISKEMYDIFLKTLFKYVLRNPVISIY